MDVGNNYSVLDHPNICFVYDYVGSKDEEKSQGDFVSISIKLKHENCMCTKFTLVFVIRNCNNSTSIVFLYVFIKNGFL